jgi:glutathione S-transferase
MRLYQGRQLGTIKGGSPNVRKVRLLAAELGLELEPVTMDITKGEYRLPEYLAKNPNGKVPTLEDDGFVLWESAAILRYLAGKRPEKSLLAAGPRSEALLDQWLFWWTSHPEPALWQLASEKLIKPRFGRTGNDASIVANAHADLARFLPVLDRKLDGEFVLGRLSILDFAFAPWLEAAPGLAVELGAHSNIASWLARLRARPYWNEV